jgi:hypothetical protein
MSNSISTKTSTPRFSKSRAPTAEATQKSEKGLISGIAASVTGLAQSLMPIPGLSAPAGIVAGISSIVGTIAGVFGFDKPTSVEAPKTVKFNWFNITHGSGLEQSTILSIDPANRVDRLSGEVGYNSDEDNLLNIAQIPQLIGTGSFSNLTQGDIVMHVPVTPMYAPVAGNLDNTLFFPTVYHTYTSFVANLFRYWRGSMVYKLKFMASNFHSGRVRITWYPGSPNSSAALVDSELYHAVGMVVDIRGNTEVEFSIPYLRPEPFLKSNLAEAVYEVSSWAQTSAAKMLTPWKYWVDNRNAPAVANGFFRVTMETALTFPSLPVPAVQYILYSHAGSDIQFAEPTTESFCNILHSGAKVIGAPQLAAVNPSNIAEVSAARQVCTGLRQAMSDPTGEVSTEVVQVEETTTFSDVADKQEAVDPRAHSSVSLNEYRMPDILDFLARPRPVFSHTWSSSEVVGTCTALDPLVMFLNSNIVTGKLSGFTYLKCDVKVDIRMNGTRFHYGAWGYSHLPYGFVADRSRMSLTQLSGLNGGVITPDTETVHSIVMPYMYNKHAFTLGNIGPNINSIAGAPEMANCGMLWSYPITPLAGGTVSGSDVAPVHLTYFVSLHNVVLSGLTPFAIPTPPIFTPEAPVVSFPVVDGIYTQNTIMNVACRPIPPKPASIVENDYDPAGLSRDGFTTSELHGDASPLVPGSSSIVPCNVLHGEYVTHLKQLICRPGHVGKFKPNHLGTFVTHFGQVNSFDTQLRWYKGMTSPAYANTVDYKNAVHDNASFLDVFREIFLIERGSVAYKLLPDVSINKFLTNGIRFEHESMTTWCLTTAGLAGDSLFDASVLAGIDVRDYTRYSAGVHFVPEPSRQPPEVIAPYHTNLLFHYVPRTAVETEGPDSHINTLMPGRIECPGVRVYMDKDFNKTSVTVLKSAGDDFQFSHLVPPGSVTYNTNRFVS